MIRAGLVGTNATSLYVDNEFEDPDEINWEEKGRTMISHIYVSFDSYLIRSIQFGFLENGVLVLSQKYGRYDGPPMALSFRAVKLMEDEYITGLSGVAGVNGGIISLTFSTNLGSHGPIGPSGYKASAYLKKEEINPAITDRCEFGGFFGSYNSTCLASIGMYVIPISSSATVVKREDI